MEEFTNQSGDKAWKYHVPEHNYLLLIFYLRPKIMSIAPNVSFLWENFHSSAIIYDNHIVNVSFLFIVIWGPNLELASRKLLKGVAISAVGLVLCMESHFI